MAHHEKYSGEVLYNEMVSGQIEAIYSRLKNHIEMSNTQKEYFNAITSKSISYISGDYVYFCERLKTAKDWATFIKILSLYTVVSFFAGIPLTALGLSKFTANHDRYNPQQNDSLDGLWLTMYLVSALSFMGSLAGNLFFHSTENFDACRDQTQPSSDPNQTSRC